MPRINRAIELLEAGQPVYYSGVRGGLNYENGTAHRDTWADYLMVDFEHGAFDPVGAECIHARACRRGHNQERTPHAGCHLHLANRRHR